ncbi:hypothetical protein NBCG_01911 [Nocardioidaceae bacterium Broad-1]|nr:hypothetical protein NBCG_01911 [Nocardioidaceae bacterium Broad-1]
MVEGGNGMSRTSFVSKLRDQVIRPLIHSALVEQEIPEVTVSVVVGTEFESSLRDRGNRIGRIPRMGTSTYGLTSYQPTNAAVGWRLGRLEDLHDPAVLVDALRQLGSDLEDWVCETTFAWGEERHARVPEIRDLPEWLIAGD